MKMNYAIAVLLFLTACAATDYYVEIDEVEGVYAGYKDKLRPDGSYTLTVNLPISADLAYSIWNRRATELCGNSDFTKNIYKAIRPTVLYENYGGAPGNFQLEGRLVCNNPVRNIPGQEEQEIVPLEDDLVTLSEQELV